MSIFNSLQSLLAQTPEVPAPEEIAQTWQQKLSALSSLSFQQFMEQAISAILHGAVNSYRTGCIFYRKVDHQPYLSFYLQSIHTP